MRRYNLGNGRQSDSYHEVPWYLSICRPSSWRTTAVLTSLDSSHLCALQVSNIIGHPCKTKPF